MPFWRSATTNDLGTVSEAKTAAACGALPVTHGKRHLPRPRGPFSTVGFVDIMTPGPPDKGSFVRILYPALDEKDSKGSSPDHLSHTRWPVWKEDKYLGGMLSFMQAMLCRWPSWAPRSEYYGIDHMGYVSPLIPHYGFPTLFRFLNGRIFVPIAEAARPFTNASQGPWPVVVFSHGLGCSRSTYSKICFDLASYGFVVAAPEHRDGSACMSYWLNPESKGAEQWIPHLKVEDGQDEYKVRNAQVHHRAREASRALDILENLNRGQVPENLLVIAGGAEHGDVLRQFEGALDLSSPVMAGHSFGGATTCLALARDERFACGVALDAWLFPLRDEDMSAADRAPLMFISTESFLSLENVRKMAEFRRGKSKDSASERKFLYIKGSVHQNHLDAPFIFRQSLVKKVVGMMSDTCPDTVMELNNKLMVQFIWEQTGKDPDPEVDDDVERMRYLLADPISHFGKNIDCDQ